MVANSIDVGMSVSKIAVEWWLGSDCEVEGDAGVKVDIQYSWEEVK
jgi:hypothetical protein